MENRLDVCIPAEPVRDCLLLDARVPPASTAGPSWPGHRRVPNHLG